MAELGKVQDYCDNLADFKEYIKNPSNVSVNSKDGLLVINAKNPIKKERLV